MGEREGEGWVRGRQSGRGSWRRPRPRQTRGGHGCGDRPGGRGQGKGRGRGPWGAAARDPRASSGPETSTRPHPGPLNPEALPARPTDPSYQEQQPPPGKARAEASPSAPQAHLSPSAPGGGGYGCWHEAAPHYDSPPPGGSEDRPPAAPLGDTLRTVGHRTVTRAAQRGSTPGRTALTPRGAARPPSPAATQRPFTAAALMPRLSTMSRPRLGARGGPTESHPLPAHGHPHAEPSARRPAPQWGPVHRGRPDPRGQVTEAKDGRTDGRTDACTLPHTSR